MSKLRIDVPDVPYHVFSRGNNKERIFFDDFDRAIFLKYWREAKEKFDYRVFSYALMDNHFHFLLKMEKDSSLARLMQTVLFQYTRYINRKYRRVGHLFQGRYNSLLVEADAYFQTVDRYIQLNPVRAGIVARPEDFPWSSYRSRFHPLQNDWIDHQTVLDYFPEPKEYQLLAYRRFTEDGLRKPEEWTLDHLSKMTCLGSGEFLRQMASRQK